MDGDNDIIYSGELNNGMPMGGVIINSYLGSNSNNWIDSKFYSKNSSIEVYNKLGNMNYVIMGDFGGTSGYDIKGSYDADLVYNKPKLKNGDISIADFNNDGNLDLVLTGEDENGVPTTELHVGEKRLDNLPASGGYNKASIELLGLRESTADWVDYDMDGDLDLFLTGIDGASGPKAILYETEIRNKKNTPPPKITGLKAEDLGFGKIKFSWDTPTDDYSSNLGYNLRLGTTPGGSELSNTLTNINGERLINQAPPIYINSFETQLPPGKYYFSVQAIDQGLKGGVFSDEEEFTLTYVWRLLNQGGIVDRSISGKSNPILKLGDIDNDNDLDLIYGSSSGGSTEVLKFDGKRLIKDASNPLQKCFKYY